MNLQKLDSDLIVQNQVKFMQENLKNENCDVIIYGQNGNIYTTKLVLASWSGFWKDLLLSTTFESDKEKVTIFLDVDKSILKKIRNFVHTGRVQIEEAQENIDILLGLEMLFPDLDFNDSQKLVMEDIGYDFEDNDKTTNNEKFEFEVKENYICNICLTYFSRKETRDNHIKNIHNKSKIFSCKKCPKTFLTENGLKAHKSKHQKKSRHQCPECHKEYQNRSDLFKHCKSKGHNEKKSTKIHCTECDFTTNRIDSLYRHERNVHKLYNKKLDAISKSLLKRGEVSCSKCGKTFKDYDKASDHFIQTSCDPIKCDICDKTFRSKSNLNLHLSDVHTKNKFDCKVCGTEFKQKRNLIRHERKCKSEKNPEITSMTTHDNSLREAEGKVLDNKNKDIKKKDKEKSTGDDPPEVHSRNMKKEKYNKRLELSSRPKMGSWGVAEKKESPELKEKMKKYKEKLEAQKLIEKIRRIDQERLRQKRSGEP